MLNNININKKKKLTVYIFLILTTLAVFWQLNQFDFINCDDPVYVTENSHVLSGINSDGLKWAFNALDGGNWHPITWLSLMLDYNLYGLNAGGYHLTNLILHILSTSLLFWLFCRMTKDIWQSAFVAVFFALHPLHVESVAWISERKDVLSAFWGMLTLCLYVYYTEKPFIKRYLLVLFSFVLALMSKPMVVTLPAIMILLDYWPLKRFELKGKIILWQLKEKIPLFVLSAIFAMITYLAQNDSTVKQYSLISRLANASVSFVSYLEKTFWPHDLAVFYPFPDQFNIWWIFEATFLIVIISIAVMLMARRLPYLFVGWLWYVITVLPVIGIIPFGEQAMADRYHYLPSVGIAVVLAWGIPSFFKTGETRQKILFPASVTFFAIMAVLTWYQCGYWKNSLTIFNHALQRTNNNYFAYHNRGFAYGVLGQHQRAIADYNEAIRLKPYYAEAYNNRGNAYGELGQHQRALADYNEAMRLKPYYAEAYNNRGNAYYHLGQYHLAIENYDRAIYLRADKAEKYYNRGNAYFKLGQHQRAIADYNEAIRLKPHYAEAHYNRGNVYYDLGQYHLAIENYDGAIYLKADKAEKYYNRGNAYSKLGQYQQAMEDYNTAIIIKSDYAEAYYNRGNVYVKIEQYSLAVEDYNKAIAIKNNYTKAYNNRGVTYYKLGRYQRAIADYSEAIRLKPDYAEAYNNRGRAYLKEENKALGCRDQQKACVLGHCELFKEAKDRKDCR